MGVGERDREMEGEEGQGSGLSEEGLPVSVARQSSFGTFNSSQRVTMPPIYLLL